VIFVIPLVDRVRRVSLRIVTMPIESQGIITRDNVSVGVSAVAYYRVEDAVRSIQAIENVSAAISQIAQTTLRAVVGRHTLDETLSETDKINDNIREILDVQTRDWGVKVAVVELKDIQLPGSMQRAMARQAEAEREKRAKIIAAEGESLAAGELGRASDIMMEHPSRSSCATCRPWSRSESTRTPRSCPGAADEHDRRRRRLPQARVDSRDVTR
jgi:regulator of protease activity HflC (stomatin/prohibitin superfamily)